MKTSTTKRHQRASKSHDLSRVFSCLSLAGLGFTLSILVACNKPPQSEAPHTPPANVRSSADVVKATAAPANVTAGGTGEATVTLSIAKGYHVNANPATYDYLIATQLTPVSAEGITAGKPVYPTGMKQKFQFADQPLAVYEGETQIKLPLSVAANAVKGPHSLPLNIRVQACDQEKCFPPDTVRSTAPVEIK